MIPLGHLADLMMGDPDDQRAARIAIEAESFAKAAICAIEELLESGYGIEAEMIDSALRARLSRAKLARGDGG